MNDNLEIERKFLIRYPKTELLAGCTESCIFQTYLLRGDDNERVRKRGHEGSWSYTHTLKKHLTDITRIEIEKEISEEEYTELLAYADPSRRTVEKTRYCLEYKEQIFEIDVYPFWDDRATLELELKSEDQPICFPPELEIVKELTHDKRYTNHSLAKEIIYENI